MSIMLKYIMNLLEESVGARKAKQIVYVLLLLFDVERKTIIKVFGASKTTLCKYKTAIEAGNPDIIFEQNYNRPESELEKYRDEIYRAFEENPPATEREAAVMIEEITGLKRSLPQIGKFLKKGASKI